MIEQDEWRFRGCADCGLVFLSPILSDAELAELYSNPGSGGTRGYVHKKASKLRRARIRVRVLAGGMAGGAKGCRFLDVGCSGSFMTQAAVAAGFITWGIDRNGEAVVHAKAHYHGRTYQVSSLAEFAADFAARSEEPFDAVYCSEVLEHVADANTFGGAISGLMVPGGNVSDHTRY